MEAVLRARGTILYFLYLQVLSPAMGAIGASMGQGRKPRNFCRASGKQHCAALDGQVGSRGLHDAVFRRARSCLVRPQARCIRCRRRWLPTWCVARGWERFTMLVATCRPEAFAASDASGRRCCCGVRRRDGCLGRFLLRRKRLVRSEEWCRETCLCTLAGARRSWPAMTLLRDLGSRSTGLGSSS
jgi:hypothetical protein